MRDRAFKKPLRYKGHDYRAPCCVHITCCTHERQPLFGTLTPAGMSLNAAGRFTETALNAIQCYEQGIAVDTHIIMPDHIHAILVLGTNPAVQTVDSVPDVVRRLKLRVMRSWPKGIATEGWPRYQTHLWHPSYHDTLIRNEAHLHATREYILSNPGRWIERMEAEGRC